MGRTIHDGGNRRRRFIRVAAHGGAIQRVQPELDGQPPADQERHDRKHHGITSTAFPPRAKPNFHPEGKELKS
jgi:hypothetical protein